MRRLALLLTFAAGPLVLAQPLEVTGHVLDPQGKPVASAAVHLLVGSDDIAQTKSDSQGEFRFDGLIRGTYTLRAEAPAFVTVAQSVTVAETQEFDVQFRELTAQKQSVVITAKILEPGVDLRNSEVFNRTLTIRCSSSSTRESMPASTRAAGSRSSSGGSDLTSITAV